MKGDPVKQCQVSSELDAIMAASSEDDSYTWWFASCESLVMEESNVSRGQWSIRKLSNGGYKVEDVN